MSYNDNKKVVSRDSVSISQYRDDSGKRRIVIGPLDTSNISRGGQGESRSETPGLAVAVHAREANKMARQT